MRCRFLSILFLAIILVACQQGDNNSIPVAQKQKAFTALHASIVGCRATRPEAVLQCVDSVGIQPLINQLNLSPLTAEIWLAFLKADALITSNYGLEALEVINDALPLTADYSFIYERARLISLRSFVNTNHFHWQLAAYDAYQAAGIFQELGLTKDAASQYLAIANLQYNAGNSSLAIPHAHRAIELFLQNNVLNSADSLWLLNAYNTLGMSYTIQHKTDSARINFNHGLQVAKLQHSKVWEGLIQGGIARIDVMDGDLNNALWRFNQEIATCLEYKEFASAGAACTGLAELFTRKGDLKKAKLFYDSARKFIELQRRPIVMITYYKNLYDWFTLNKQYDSAHLILEKYNITKDSMQDPQSQQLMRLQEQTQFEKQLSLLRIENDLKISELKTSRILIISFVVLFILFSILLYTIRSNYLKVRGLNGLLENKVKARTAELVKLNKELDTYLYRASHDVRGPILRIVGLGQLAGMTHDGHELKSIQQKINDTARDMDKMLSKIHMAYELDKLEGAQIINLTDYIYMLKKKFKSLYPLITFESDLQHEVFVYLNIKLLDTIFINIFENACIFNTLNTPTVFIKMHVSNGFIEVNLRDNGIGIDAQYLRTIFDAYTRYSDRSIGSGLGLHLVQKALVKLNGRIVVDSVIYHGSEFKITLPSYTG